MRGSYRHRVNLFKYKSGRKLSDQEEKSNNTNASKRYKYIREIKKVKRKKLSKARASLSICSRIKTMLMFWVWWRSFRVYYPDSDMYSTKMIWSTARIYANMWNGVAYCDFN